MNRKNIVNKTQTDQEGALCLFYSGNMQMNSTNRNACYRKLKAKKSKCSWYHNSISVKDTKPIPVLFLVESIAFGWDGFGVFVRK